MTPTATRRVQLKRVIALQPGDRIVPRLGFRRRDGQRFGPSSAALADTWGSIAWHVIGLATLDFDAGEAHVVITDMAGRRDTWRVPMDAFLALAPKDS